MCSAEVKQDELLKKSAIFTRLEIFVFTLIEQEFRVGGSIENMLECAPTSANESLIDQ